MATKTKLANPANENGFAALITRYNALVNNGEHATQTPAYAETLDALSKAVALSVLKKLFNASGNAQMRSYTRDIVAGQNADERRRYALEHGAHRETTREGHTKRVVDDADLNCALTKLQAYVCGDGCDLVSVAAVALLEATAEQGRRETEMPCDLERVYTKRVLDRRVLIRDSDSAAWRDEETAPIRECFRAVRAYILKNAAPRNTSKFIYLDASGECADGDGEMVDTADREMYRRYSVYAGLDGYRAALAPAVTDGADTKRVMEAARRLDLTDSQREVLKLRLRGAGKKAIARYLGVSVQAVKDTIRRIQRKALAAGISPTAYTPETDETAATLLADIVGGILDSGE